MLEGAFNQFKPLQFIGESGYPETTYSDKPMSLKQLQEFEIRNNYTEEYLYDELNVHLDDNVLLIFRKNENTKDDKKIFIK